MLLHAAAMSGKIDEHSRHIISVCFAFSGAVSYQMGCFAYGETVGVLKTSKPRNTLAAMLASKVHSGVVSSISTMGLRFRFLRQSQNHHIISLYTQSGDN